MLKPTFFSNAKSCSLEMARLELALYFLYVRAFRVTKLNPLFTNSVEAAQVMNMEINECGSPM